VTLALTVLVLILPALWFGVPLALRRLQVRRLSVFCAAHRVIVLTYDDGPSPETTTALADLLARRGAVASFFMIGARAVAHPGLVARLLTEGHEIGNHTQLHLNAWKTPPLAPVRDLRVGAHTLRYLGVPAGPFRPPYGKTTLATLLALRVERCRTAFWTIDTRDSWEQQRSVVEVLDRIEHEGGGVVLMHDFAFPPRGAADHHHPEHVLKMTEAILDFAAAQNFRVLRFSDMCVSGGTEGGTADNCRER